MKLFLATAWPGVAVFLNQQLFLGGLSDILRLKMKEDKALQYTAGSNL